ncbi:MAG: hypothetical protein ACRYGM_02910 [Janthinobacterium lividum]
MVWLDARLPVRFGPLDSRTPTDAVLTDRSVDGSIDDAAVAAPSARFQPAAPTHPAGCACCLPRSTAALALATLFRDRALSPATPFAAVLAVVTPQGEAAIRAALQDDPLASARYRLAQARMNTPQPTDIEMT